MPNPLTATVTPPFPALPDRSAQSLRSAAVAVEGMFLRELLKPLEENGLGGGAGILGEEENASKQWNRMQLDALTEQSAGNLGLADTLVRELSLRPQSGLK